MTTKDANPELEPLACACVSSRPGVVTTWAEDRSSQGVAGATAVAAKLADGPRRKHDLNCGCLGSTADDSKGKPMWQSSTADDLEGKPMWRSSTAHDLEGKPMWQRSIAPPGTG